MTHVEHGISYLANLHLPVDYGRGGGGICIGSAEKKPFFKPDGTTNDPLFQHGATYDLILA